MSNDELKNIFAPYLAEYKHTDDCDISEYLSTAIRAKSMEFVSQIVKHYDMTRLHVGDSDIMSIIKIHICDDENDFIVKVIEILCNNKVIRDERDIIDLTYYSLNYNRNRVVKFLLGKYEITRPMVARQIILNAIQSGDMDTFRTYTKI